MKKQNFNNHRQLVPLYHGIALLLVLTILVGAIIKLLHALNTKLELYTSLLIFGIAVVLGFILWFSRFFALRAQDRAIRAEESLRYFLLSHERIDKRLRLGQIIALRFASDEEFVALAKKAADENLSPRQIKMAINNWKGDYHRV